MHRLTNRNLLVSKLRLFLTIAAVTVWVSFVSATFVLSDTMAKSFDELYAGLTSGTDVDERSEAAIECARRALDAAHVHSFGHTHHTVYQVACIYAITGDDRQALALLERAVDTGFRCWPFFRVDPCLSRLQRLPEFERYVAEIEAECRQVPSSGV